VKLRKQGRKGKKGGMDVWKAEQRKKEEKKLKGKTQARASLGSPGVFLGTIEACLRWGRIADLKICSGEQVREFDLSREQFSSQKLLYRL
jgi:hypothetical protein